MRLGSSVPKGLFLSVEVSSLMKIREADFIKDADQLSRFVCAGSASEWCENVELAIRTCAEFARRGPHRHVFVVEDADARLCAVAVARAIYSDPDLGWHVEALAVQLDIQDDDLGTNFLYALVEMIGMKHPRAIVQWIVHEENGAMLRVSEKLGARREFLEEQAVESYVPFLVAP